MAIEDCTLFQTLFGCRFGHSRAKQQPGPLATGSCDPLLCRLQAGSQACRTSWRAKGPPRVLLRLQGKQPLDFRATNLSRQESSRSIMSFCLFQSRENKYCGIFIDLWYRPFGEALGGWLRLLDQGTILVGPRERTAIQVCG